MASQHILLAENRPNLQHSLGLMLKQADYRVSFAETTEEALILSRTMNNTPEAVGLLIVDLDSASPEACRAFMKTLSASGLAIPYLILAEEIHDQAVNALKNHGCLACITKPFEPETLLRSVGNAFTQPSPQNGHQLGRTSENTSTENPVDQCG